jgi:hypothetical protein
MMVVCAKSKIKIIDNCGTITEVRSWHVLIKTDTTNFEPTLFRTSILESGEPETGAYWSDVSTRSRDKRRHLRH